MPKPTINLRSGDRWEYESEKHLLNFINPNEINKLDFLEICRFAEYHEWSANLTCHGGGCLFQFKHAFYILINKEIFIKKYNEDPNFIPNINQTSLDFQNITTDDALALQKIVLDIKLKKFMNEIKFDNNLYYLGVIMHMVGEKVELENKKITKFLIPEFKKLYPNETTMINKLNDIYFNGQILTWHHLEIIAEGVKSHNSKKLLRRKRIY